MKTGRLLSFLLLATFLTFILSHSYNPINPPFLHTHIKLIIDDGKEENFQFKNHEKKHSGLFCYQGVEIFQAFIDFFRKK